MDVLVRLASPKVNVPVLSKTITSMLFSFSKALLSFSKIPFFKSLEFAITFTAGIARADI